MVLVRISFPCKLPAARGVSARGWRKGRWDGVEEKIRKVRGDWICRIGVLGMGGMTRRKKKSISRYVTGFGASFFFLLDYHMKYGPRGSKFPILELPHGGQRFSKTAIFPDFSSLIVGGVFHNHPSRSYFFFVSGYLKTKQNAPV